MMLSVLGTIFAPAGIVPWWELLSRILGFFLIAWIIHRFSRRMANRLARLGQYSYYDRRSQERQKTLRGLIANLISFAAFGAATLASVGQFVAAETLVWMVGLFSAAFGLGARPLISDFLTGIGFLFEDSLSVGEKVEILGIEGVVERVNLRTIWLYAPTGELHIIPNGEVRVVRNFSRGRFSTTSIKVKVEASDLSRALPMLQELGHEAMTQLPNLLEPWQVISESGVMGQQTELTLMAKARYGKAADMRPRLLALLQERLAEAGVHLVD